MFVVTGATGNTGSVVARTLLDGGHKVRVLVRDPAKVQDLAGRGAEVVVGQLSDPKAVARALAGARGLYLMSPPDMASTSFVAQRSQLLRSLAQAARQAQVGQVVLLSSLGAQSEGHGPVRTLYAAERALEETGLPVTFVRAAYFLENWGAVWRVARQDGVLPSFLPAALAIPTVAVRDIGPVAARALLDGPRGRRIIELAGPKEVSAQDVAAVASGLLARPVTVAEAPLSAVVPTFTSFGVSEDVSRLYQEMYQSLQAGTMLWQGGADVESIRGPTSAQEGLRALP